MAFTDTQIRKLRSKLSTRHIKTREAEGQTLHYLEGWHVLAEANRIFGFDGWDRETIASDCVWTKQQGQRYCAAYVARVRITVRAGDTRVIREGCGVGDSNAVSPGQAHDFAAKAAETDATKRALMTFGNAFGLSLYRGAAEPAYGGRRTAAAGEARQVPGGEGTVSGADSAVDTAATARAVTPDTPSSQPEVFPPDRFSTGVGTVDKSVLAIPEPRRIRDPDHLRFVASEPCMVCGRRPAEAHHLKFAQPTALSRKVSDCFTVPLCALHHRELHHTGNERDWWTRRGLHPVAMAEALWAASRVPDGTMDRRLEHRDDGRSVSTGEGAANGSVTGSHGGAG